MGRPAFPSREQWAQLQAAGKLGAPEAPGMPGGKLTLSVPTHGLVVVEVR